MKAYKVFDKNWKCRDFQYKIGKKYKHKGIISLCNSGFHACKNLIDCFSYYDFNPVNKVAIIEMSGNISDGDDKSVCSEIEIIKEITWNEVLSMVNTGKNNTGYNNSGNRNSGDYNSGNSNSGYNNSGYNNSGDYNSGNSNSGNRNSGYSNSGNSNSGYNNSGNSNSGYNNSGNSNSGDYNSTNYESGFFNSVKSKYINVFNKKCLRTKWDNAEKPNFIFNLNTNIWIWFDDMLDNEKERYPKAYVCDGYLKTYTHKEAWVNAYKKATKEDIKLLKKLPNFDTKIFKQITGINLKIIL